MVEEVAVPLEVRLRFGRAAVQVVADRAGADILHIKGETVHESLRPRQMGTDVDILVRPSDVTRLDRAIRAEGWRLHSSFAYGSPFAHAQTYIHDAWGYLDLHRWFPGIRLDPSGAYEVLARDAYAIDEVGVGYRVPQIDAQAVLLVLNAARMAGADPESTRREWERAPKQDQERRLRLISELRADLAFATAMGELERFRGHPEYRLWKSVSEPGSRSAEWWGRIRAARSLPEALALIARAPLVNVERLAHLLGHEPSRREIVREFLRRPRRAASEAWRSLRRGRR